MDIEEGSGTHDFIYGDIHKILNIKDYIDHYDGSLIPYENNCFNIIICFWSFLFDYSCEFGTGNYIYPDKLEGKKLLEKKINNLMKISKKNCIWIISPPKFIFLEFINILFFNLLINLINDKQLFI